MFSVCISLTTVHDSKFVLCNVYQVVTLLSLAKPPHVVKEESDGRAEHVIRKRAFM
mgnify:CR=1 FL=1